LLLVSPDAAGSQPTFASDTIDSRMAQQAPKRHLVPPAFTGLHPTFARILTAGPALATLFFQLFFPLFPGVFQPF
jgi:hypothetical protein